MMFYLRAGFAGILAVGLVIVALANRDAVTIKLLPAPLANLLGLDPGTTVPLFLLMGGAVVFGLLLGFIWEWLREHSYRAEARRLRSEAETLRAQQEAAGKAALSAVRDDVRALVDAR